MMDEQDKIDDIFKKQLGEPARPEAYNEEHWDALERTLNGQKKRPVLWLPVVSSIAAMLLLVLGWWVFKPAGDKPLKQPVVVKKYRDPVSGSIASSSPADPTASDRGMQTIAKVTKDTTPHGLQPQAMANGLVKRAQSTFDKISAGAKGINVTGGVDTNKASGQDNDAIIAQTARVNSSELLSTPATPDTAAKSNPQVIATAPTNEQLKTAPEPTIKPNKVKAIGIKGGRQQLAIGVLASSDLNGVNSFGNQTKLGSNFGLQISVGIKKFTITTGAIYAIKPYAISLSSYAAATGYPYTKNSTDVLADCRMIDVPLNIGYQVYKQQRNKISVGAGLSSYFMLSEKYRYYYTIPNSGPASYQVPNSKNYLFSIANLNVNYERQLNSKLSLNIQPYMKIPLAAVGYSQVNLQSVGVALGINYNFNTLKPK